jgi:hypothetical protein
VGSTQALAHTDDDSGIPTWIVPAGFAAVAAAIWAGWLLYRRRLP